MSTLPVPDDDTELPHADRLELETGQTTRSRRGFAAMDRALVREIARKGGVAAHRSGTAHEFTREEARAAGRKGGYAAHGLAPPSESDGDYLD